MGSFNQEAFLEGVLGKTKQQKGVERHPDPTVPDSSKVEVPAELYEMVTGRKPKTARPVKEIVEEKATQQVEEEETELVESNLITESTGQELVSLLLDVRGLLMEMCGVGSLGMNMAQKDDKKAKERKSLIRDRLKKRGKK